MIFILKNKNKFKQDILLFFQTIDITKAYTHDLKRLGGDIFIDGSFKTAAISKPYKREKDNFGKLYYNQHELNSFAEEAVKNDIQIAFHAIGDRAIEQALNAIEFAQKKKNRNSFRNRIEHFELASDAQIKKAKKLNIGLDLDLWKSAIHLTVDVFHERRTDILCTPGTIPSTIGVTSLPSINAGIVTNKGFEIELEHRKNFRNWGYSVKGNFSYAKNKIISADEPDNVDKPWQRRAGTSIDEMYGYIAEGLFQTWDEINDPDIAKTTASNLQPGDIRYKDLNGDGVINDDDRGYLGKNSTPDKIVGLALSGNWKNFDFSVLFQAALGGNTWFTGSAIWPFESKASVSQDVLNNYWSTNNTAEQNANVFYPRLSSDHSDNNYIESTYWLKSSDYLRLKNVEIGYRLPKSVNKFLGVEELRFYANAVNLITWDHMKIFDPESPNGAVNYPQMKVFNFGVHVSF